MKRILIILALVIMIFGCSVNKQLMTLNTVDNEAIMGGRIEVIYNEHNITENSTIYFKDISTGKLINYSVGSSGYIITKFPLGKYYLSRIICGKLHTEIPAGLIEFKFDNNQKVFYLGDLAINWAGPEFDYSEYFGLAGAVVDDLTYFSNIDAYSRDNIVDFRAYLSLFYDSSKEIEYYDLKLPEIEESKYQNLFSEPEVNPEYLAFNLTTKKIIYGKLRMVKKNEIYVEDGRKLYLFSRNKLISITDLDNNDVTDEVLQQTEFNKIRYNSYEVIEF